MRRARMCTMLSGARLSILSLYMCDVYCHPGFVRCAAPGTFSAPACAVCAYRTGTTVTTILFSIWIGCTIVVTVVVHESLPPQLSELSRTPSQPENQRTGACGAYAPRWLEAHSSAALFVEVSLRSPQKLFLFVIKTYINRIKVSKKWNELILKKSPLE